MKTSLKALLGGSAIAIVAAFAVAPSAHAATCWWSGGDWNCTTPPPMGAVIAPKPVPDGGMAGLYRGEKNTGQYNNGTPVSYIPAPSWGFSPNDYR